MRDAKIDLFKRYPELWSKVYRSWPPDEWEIRTDHMVETYAALNLGSRIVNELMIVSTHPQKKRDFGEQARIARANPEFSAHNHIHERLAKAIQQAGVIVLGESLYDETGLMGVAAAMKPHLHDFMQLLMEQRKYLNKKDPDLQKVNPKSDHGEAAAVLIHVLRPYIQQIGHLSDDLTDRLIAVLSADISLHDSVNPSKTLQQRLKQDDLKNAATFETEASLYQAYKDGSLDRLTLSGAQWFSILHQRQLEASEKGGYSIGVYGIYGLGPLFEERFVDLIPKALQNTHAVDWRAYPIDRSLLYKWALLFNIADTYEMIIPGAYSVIRKLQVSFYALNRPLIKVDTDFNEALDIAQGAEERTNKWNNSEWVRTMREYLDFIDLILESPFAKNNPLFIDLFTNTILYNMYLTEQFFEQLAKGSEGFIWFDEILNSRVAEVSLKAIRRSFLGPGVSLMDNAARKQRISGMPAVFLRELVITVLEGMDPDSKYLPRFKARCNIIARELDLVKKTLKRKPGIIDGKLIPSEGDVFIYPSDDINKLKKNFQAIWKQACETLRVTESVQQDLLSDAFNFTPEEFAKKWSMIANVGHDPLGEQEDARVMHELNKQIRDKLETPPFDVPFDWDSLEMIEKKNAWLFQLLAH